ALRKQLKELFPNENIVVSAAGDLVVLSGEVSDIRVPERVLAVGRLHAPKLANQLHVRGNQQVQIEVKFAEVSRSGLREMGFNFFHNNIGMPGGDRLGGVTSPATNLNGYGIRPVTGSNDAVYPGVPNVYNRPFGDAFSLFFSGLAQ